MGFEAGHQDEGQNVEPVRLSKRSATFSILRLKGLELVLAGGQSEA